MCWFVIFYTDHQLPTWEEVANVCVRTGVVWVVWTGGAGVLSGFDGWQGGQGGEQFVLCYRESHSYLFLLCSTTTCGDMTSRKKRGKPVPSGVNRERSEAALKIMADSIQHRLERASEIKNKAKRQQVYRDIQKDRAILATEVKKKRKRMEEELGENAPKKQKPDTLDSMRRADETTVEDVDEEVLGDEEDDEFAPYFRNDKTPKLMITTRPRPSRHLFKFIAGLTDLIPNLFFYPRKEFTLKQISGFASNKNFTHLIVLGEKAKVCNGMIISHLPEGPTAQFKVTSIVDGKNISGHGRVTNHLPEIILNNFSTRLGHRVGRFLGSMFPHDPEFVGRRVVTFHNQRDFIFVRQHRYMFEEDKRSVKKPEMGVGSEVDPEQSDPKRKKGMKVRAKMQEIGPQFCLKMRWLQGCAFDTKTGEYEWIHKQKEMGKDRKTFYL